MITTDAGVIRSTAPAGRTAEVTLTMTLRQAHELGRWLYVVGSYPDTSYRDGEALLKEVHSWGWCDKDCPTPLPSPEKS